MIRVVAVVKKTWALLLFYTAYFSCRSTATATTTKQLPRVLRGTTKSPHSVLNAQFAPVTHEQSRLHLSLHRADDGSRHGGTTQG